MPNNLTFWAFGTDNYTTELFSCQAMSIHHILGAENSKGGSNSDST